MLIIFLVVASAFLHALWNALLKRHPDAPTAGVAAIILSALWSIALVPFEEGPYFSTWRALLLALCAGLFESGYIFTLGRALQRLPLSVVYPIARGGALCVVWPVSVLWLGEPFFWWAIPGLFCLWAGLYLCAGGANHRERSERHPRGGGGPELSSNRERVLDSRLRGNDGRGGGNDGRGDGNDGQKRGLWLAIFCAACIGGYSLCYKLSLQSGATPVALSALSLSFSAPLSVLFLGSFSKLWSVTKTSGWYLLLIGFLSALSFILFAVALRSYDAGAALTLRNVSIVFAQLLALWMGERPSRLQWLGALLVTAGAILVNMRP